MKMKQQLIWRLLLCLLPFNAFGKTCTTPGLYDQHPWSAMYYYAQTVNSPLFRIFILDMKHWPEQIQSFEVARTLDQDNFLRQFLSPIVGITQLAGNLTIRNGKREPTIYEFDPYLIFRWANMPWNNYVDTSLALAEGVSYTSSIPWIEKRNNNNAKRFLNYLMFEATFAHPCYQQLQLIARIHHRSGAFGLYRAGNSGSNDIGLGVRYLF